MNGTTSGTTERGPVPAPAGPLTVKEAAAHFGIGERAVRKRIAAGTLYAEQIDGEWQVYPRAVPIGSAHGSAEQFRTATEPRNCSAEPPSTSGESAAVAVMERLVSPLVAQLAAQTAQLGNLREELGRERTLREIAERHATELEHQLTSQAVPPSSPESQARPVVPPLRPRSALSSLMTALARRLG